jgi:hypothetical protein
MGIRVRSPFPLPDGWSDPELVEDLVIADGVELHRAGAASRAPTGEEVTGAAADHRTLPRSRCYFELLERVAVMEAMRATQDNYDLLDENGEKIGRCKAVELFPESDAPATWRYARTNGAAIHVDWPNAARRACWELCERDRLLRAWRGDLIPLRAAFDFARSPLGRTSHYEWCAYDFPLPTSDPRSLSCDVHVAAIFGFPKIDTAPFVLGFGARPDAADARAVAEREAMQSLAFLWGEAVCAAPPPSGPTPLHHLDHYQYRPHQDIVRRWLDGEHRRRLRGPSMNRDRDDSLARVKFVDLTPPWIGGGMRVAKAICSSALPLTFGLAPTFQHLPPELRVHPIA